MSSELELSEFLKYFPPISLHNRQPESFIYPWVFWSKSEGCENSSFSADLDNPKIHDKIKSALSNAEYSWGFLGQFWAPVTLDGIWVLSTSGQPFAIRRLSNKFAIYRLYSEKRKYNIDDANKLDVEPEDMIISGGPSTAFLNCRTYMNKFQGFLSESDYYGALNFSVMVPICLPSQSNCIGVLEFTLDHSECELASFLFHTVKTIKKAGLDVFYVQDLIPYKTIDGLEVTKDEIEEALKVICGSHNLALAQVWISYEDKRIVPFTYSWEDSQTPKRLLAIKLTGYLCAGDFEQYFRFGDVSPCANIEELPLVTLNDYESRYISNLRSEMLVGCHLELLHLPRALAICLRSHETSDLNYVFEFMWTKHSNHVTFLEAILLTLKRCLPRFKFASGAELGDELNVIDVENSTDDITEKFKIFQGKRLSLMPEARDEAKKTMVVDYIAPSEVTCKTTVKVLPREVIEMQFGKTMKDAAINLNVSLSTFKRKFKALGIPEWPGPNFLKRNKSCNLKQFNTNEEDNGAIEDTSAVNLNKNVLTVKAEYEDDIIKFHLPISQATFVHVENEIGKRLELSDKTYKLKYLDEDGDWITLKSDEEMADCIKSSRNLNRIVVRMRVLPSRQPISCPSV